MTYFGEDHGGLLFFRIPAERYKSTHFHLCRLMYSQVWSMGLTSPFFTVNRKMYRLDDGTEKSKEGESIILPHLQRNGKGAFPTLAIECGNSVSPAAVSGSGLVVRQFAASW